MCCSTGAQGNCANCTVVSYAVPDFQSIGDGNLTTYSQEECCAACANTTGCNMWRVEPGIPFDITEGMLCDLYAVPHGTKLLDTYPNVSFTGVSIGPPPSLFYSTHAARFTTTHTLPVLLQ